MSDIVDVLRKTRKGAMFIIEAPSGTGKSTIVKELLKQDSNLKFSVSVTTRKPREGEKEGVDYYYITDEKYNELLAQDAFYECVNSQYGSRYGTLRSEVDSFINIGQDVIFDMDWIGAEQMRKKAPDDVVTIYLLPPSVKEVRRRLEDRKTDSKETIEKRMNLIAEKLKHYNEFDYVIVNADVDETVRKVQRVISGERMKRVRQNGLPSFVESLLKEANSD
ncbi:MAG: guanylate kinase [Alphaproteobacteria bacterium]|nr:guanylate kinase [Alphaproteobacteria bacterium]